MGVLAWRRYDVVNRHSVRWALGASTTRRAAIVAVRGKEVQEPRSRALSAGYSKKPRLNRVPGRTSAVREL